jgi:2-polyprenyl-3-methyl-5-hydroxy-6-metoxy-1,4-benzoquinol methylase
LPVDRQERKESAAVTISHTDAAWLNRVRAVWNGRAAMWDEMSEAYAGASDRADDLRRTVEALRLKQGAALLDAGCGSGQFAMAFAEMGYRVTGVDLAPEMIARAERHAEERGVRVAWRVGDLSRLPEPLAVYDAIHARVVLLFVPDVPATLKEFRRVLKPGGRLYASVPGALSPIYNRSWRRHVDRDNVGTNFMTPWELETILTEFGWQIVDEWGEFGRSLTGEENALKEVAIASLPRRLQQAAVTTWTLIAR